MTTGGHDPDHRFKQQDKKKGERSGPEGKQASRLPGGRRWAASFDSRNTPGQRRRRSRAAQRGAKRRDGSQPAAYGHETSRTSRSTISIDVTPSASALKFVTSRCRNVGPARVRTSSISGVWRPVSSARVLAPRMRYCEARGPAPQRIQSLHKLRCLRGPGRLARTRRTAYSITLSATGTRRTRSWNAPIWAPVSTWRGLAGAGWSSTSRSGLPLLPADSPARD